MKYIYIPSKTFLLGEYLALKGGPAILALTTPSFSVDESKHLHPDCMAARYWFSKTQKKCDWGLKDPYLGKGGLGASSAEFLLAYAQLEGHFENRQHLYETYLAFSDVNAAQKPSGYDVIAQTSQGLSVVEASPLRCKSFAWPFDDIGFILIHTGQKLKTHSHLQETLHILNWKKMALASEQAIFGLEHQNADAFIDAIRLFGDSLDESGFVALHTQQILETIKKEHILAAKGCGAMGADVILVLVEKSRQSILIEQWNQKNIDILATDADLFFQNAKK